MSYEKLLEELGGTNRALKKAMDAAPMPMNADGGEGEEDEKGEGEDDAPPPMAMGKGGKKGKGAMSKALNVTLENGETVQAFDGSELVGVLMQRTEGLHAALTKSLGIVEAIAKRNVDLEGQVTEMKKSLDAIGEVGRGRKSVVQLIGGDPEGTENGKKGITTGEFMNKSLVAMRAGRVTGGEVTRINALVNNGKPIPEDLINKVLSA